MELFKKTCCILGGNFPRSKNKKTTLKKFLTSREMELSRPKVKKPLYFPKKRFSYISGRY